MMKFLVILFIFTIAHGVCFTAIMSPQTRSWNMLRDVVFHPYYNIYGELFFQEPTSTTTIFGTEKRNSYSSSFGLIMLAIYVLIANVLLLNLLIAVFGNIYQDIKENAHRVWAYQRYKLTVEYAQRSRLVPPFTIFYHMCRFGRWLCSCPCKGEDKEDNTHTLSLRKKLGLTRNLEINAFESKILKIQNGATTALDV